MDGWERLGLELAETQPDDADDGRRHIDQSSLPK
jgi:hypothetical protein